MSSGMFEAPRPVYDVGCSLYWYTPNYLIFDAMTPPAPKPTAPVMRPSAYFTRMDCEGITWQSPDKASLDRYVDARNELIKSCDAAIAQAKRDREVELNRLAKAKLDKLVALEKGASQARI